MKEELRREISLDRAIQLLSEDGITVNKEEAEIILNFLIEIAEIVVDQHLYIKKNRKFK